MPTTSAIKPTNKWKRGPRRKGFPSGSPPNPQPFKLCNYRLPMNVVEELHIRSLKTGVTKREIVEKALADYFVKHRRIA